MKLLMISGDRSVLAGKRGPFWYTLEEFRRHWERIDVICPSAAQQGLHEVFDNVFFHPSPRGLWYQTRWIRHEGARLLEEHGHGVMTAHEFAPFYNGMGARGLTRRTGVPHVLEVHHVVGHPRPAGPQEVVGLVMSRTMLVRSTLRAAAVRVVNGPTRDLLVSWGAPADKIRVVPSFYLDPAILHPDTTTVPRYDLAFCGRLAPNKNLASLLRALRLLPKVTLLVIGDGPSRDTLVALAERLGLANRVTFAGWLPTQEDVVAAVRGAKVFVMPSLSEGGPRVALEAMACGLPVVATRVGVMPDVIKSGENGFLISGEPHEMAGILMRLLQDPLLRRKVGDAASRITQTFDRRTLIAAYADFLKSAATGAKTLS